MAAGTAWSLGRKVVVYWVETIWIQYTDWTTVLTATFLNLKSPFENLNWKRIELKCVSSHCNTTLVWFCVWVVHHRFCTLKTFTRLSKATVKISRVGFSRKRICVISETWKAWQVLQVWRIKVLSPQKYLQYCCQNPGVKGCLWTLCCMPDKAVAAGLLLSPSSAKPWIGPCSFLIAGPSPFGCLGVWWWGAEYLIWFHCTQDYKFTIVLMKTFWSYPATLAWFKLNESFGKIASRSTYSTQYRENSYKCL